jgi:NhaA family Na+:H+ antiporter
VIPGDGERAGVLAPSSSAETSRIATVLRTETFGGALLLVATICALVWANSPWSADYTSVTTYRAGPSALRLHLSLAEWASDGLLAIFFFVAGLELKREFVAGELRSPRRAAVPVAAACGGVLVPALLFTVINLGGDGDTHGWAIPTATDIAFALAVLAIISSHLPAAMRTFLLTLAVVDDLIAITIIAIFYTSDLDLVPLLLAFAPLALFALAVQRGVPSWWLLIPLGVCTWALVHASGVHATVAGVLLAAAVPVRRRARRATVADGPGLAERFEHAWRPISTAVAVPFFALLSAGVTVGGLSGLATSLTDRVALGIVIALVAGKTAGVFGATWLVARFTHADLDEGLAWIDVFGLAILCGVGFTVSLLIGELAFGPGSIRDDHVKVGVLTGSVVAALLATVVLRLRNRRYRRVQAEELLARS